MRRMVMATVLIALPGLALAQGKLPDTSHAVSYDDGITWSWEEEVEPLDVLQFMHGASL